ncbi:MAG: PP2C family protein-serine/threonine phosphatase [bacterium]
MKADKRLFSILAAVLGGVGIALYFIAASFSDIAAVFRLERSKDEILQKATETFQDSELAATDLSRKVSLQINKTLLTYAQTRLDHELPEEFFPVASWVIRWQGTVDTKKEGRQEVEFRLEYDFKGNLIRLQQLAPHLTRPPNFKESQAVAEAKTFLASLGADTTALTLTNKTINTEDRVRFFNFVFLNPSPISPDLQEIYEVTISGEIITSYRARVTFDADSPLTPESHRTSTIVSLILAMVVWLGISIVLIIKFFVKLRHDELEFKRGSWFAVAGFVLMWAMVAIASWPVPEAMLFGGGLAGLVTGLALLVVYPVADSVNRDVWPQRLALGDILFRGFFRVRELGKSFLDSLFITGTTLVLVSFLVWLVRVLNVGYVEFEDNVLWVFNGTLAALSAGLNNAMSAAFIGLVLFSFWLAYLEEKTAHRTTLILVFALVLNLAGLDLYTIQPTYLAVVLLLPVAGLWAFFALKYDLLAIFLALFAVHSFLELIFLPQLPNALWSPQGLFCWAYVLLLFGGGVYLIFAPRTVSDFEHYVPEYVGRIAERERFLKELEIARGVQIRFLPQSVPSFKNLDIACLCRPAMEVGGDYYDFIPNGDNSLGVIIGDVSGKGVSAAFYMTMVKGILKTLSKTTSTPRQLLSEMNLIFYENVPQNVFISVIYGEFDVDKRVLKFARAGHNPLIMRKHAAGKTEFVVPKGLAIGLDKGGLFSRTIEEIEISIEKGDVFVFYTDGISESVNKKGDEFGEERLRQVVQDNTNGSAQNLLDKVSAEVARFSGDAQQHDDFTIVVVKVGEV